jgi:hypothetical protein
MVVLLYSTELDQLGKDDADEWAAHEHASIYS